MEALGRLLNPVAAADGVYLSMRDAVGITFSCYLSGAAGDTYTLVEAQDASGTGAQNLAVITDYRTSTGDASDTWVEHTQAAAATVTASATAAQNQMVVEVDGTQLSDGYGYVKLTSTESGQVHAIARDLTVQRKPSNLAALGA